MALLCGAVHMILDIYGDQVKSEAYIHGHHCIIQVKNLLINRNPYNDQFHMQYLVFLSWQQLTILVCHGVC